MARGNLNNIKKQQEEKYNISKEWLYEKYFLEKLSLKEVGKLIGSSAGPIRHRLKKYGFAIRNSGEAAKGKKIPVHIVNARKTRLLKEDLYQKYILNLESSQDIAMFYGCSNTTVLKYIKEYGIPVRTGSEAKKGNLNPSFNKPSKQRGIKRTPEQLINIRSSLSRGEAHFRYKKPEDRVEPINGQIRNCQKSKDWKFSVLKRDNFCCVICQSKKDLEVDHIVSFSEIKKKYNIKNLEDALLCEDLWDINNGRVLCLEHHKQTESYGFKGKKQEAEDLNG